MKSYLGKLFIDQGMGGLQPKGNNQQRGKDYCSKIQQKEME